MGCSSLNRNLVAAKQKFTSGLLLSGWGQIALIVLPSGLVVLVRQVIEKSVFFFPRLSVSIGLIALYWTVEGYFFFRVNLIILFAVVSCNRQALSLVLVGLSRNVFHIMTLSRF